MSSIDESLVVFAEESEDLLSVAEQALLRLDDLEQSDEQLLDSINDLFRTFHTIKGSAGLFGLGSIVDFTHVVESVLVRLREGSLAINEQMVSLFLSSTDHLQQLVEHELQGLGELTASLKSDDSQLLDKLNVYLDAQLESVEHAEQSGPAGVDGAPTSTDDGESVANKNWHVSLRFAHNTLRNGMDPASFIAYLRNLGQIDSIVVVDDAIPAWREFDPQCCYLGFEIELLAQTSKAQIEEVFEFVQDDCKINILPPHSQIQDYISLIEVLPEENMRIGEILVACGALTTAEMDNVLAVQDNMIDEATCQQQGAAVPALGEIAVDEKVVEQEVVDAAVKKQQNVKDQQSRAVQSVRVNSVKLENLINLVGELVIGTANVQLHADHSDNSELKEGAESLSRLVEAVRDTALGLRMVPVGETFNRFKRVVREVSRELEKDIELRISGADTEMDKTIIEKITDPLMHLVRNAVDHGIELPKQRIAIGKPARGVVSLDAFHDSGSIVIRISDDGGGLSKEKILKKALEKSIIHENQSLSDAEIYRLIFEAGFSTAESISNISGRGVGMDVVRKNIESLRGQIEIESEEGKGSAISIKLPLTLAIIDGFQVRVDDTQYIIPLEMVDECITLNDSLRGDDKDANYVNLRGEILPFMHLNKVFSDQTHDVESQGDNIIIVEFAGQRAGFVVDELLGEHQTVIKPLGRIFQHLKGISGATILGSGEVAMILDVAQVLDKVMSAHHTAEVTSTALH